MKKQKKLTAALSGLARKVELVEMAEAAEWQPPEGSPWPALKLPDLREAMLAHADKCDAPALLAEIYENVAEPSVPYGWGDD